MGIGIGIGLLPIYLIFKRLESLIVKYVSNPQINFEQQPEIRSLKRLLIFVFVMNIIINAFPIKHPSEASMQTLLSGIENPVIMNMAKSFFYSEGFFYWYQTITSWIYVSFDGVMPLFYIVLGYCTLKINSEHKQLKEELDQVV